MQLSLMELWPAMGPLAKGVVLLLVGMSLLSLTVAVERMLALARSGRESARFLQAWRHTLSERGIVAAAAEAKGFPHSHVAHLVEEATRLAADGSGDERAWLEAYDRTARRIIVATGVDAKRGLGVLATVGSTAPFVGLFGTVVGIVTAFHTMGVTGQGGLGSVSAGIAEALVSTALGILVAIPALWLFNALTQRIQRLLAELECVAEELAVAALGEAQRTAARPLHLVGR
ncbi:MAG TPA: MotA/TolQ/ExbB proton channel family protein [Candidatus Binatia bacterium]|nr:MotA/TolQ/ExbB proton channel family protein [Candidatus Binatia bacterium]